ncbi:hypothetical protein [Actinoplanes sp. N902-109]|uniref:hypothetical protein n=1 Tax=Actinoplanes sp. (strain N902-109) TaxID=649831 RepID=UPI0003296646|nr:hypothetical protein [Actinoplanes sp. N902-109]AGL18045.1 hypothetical protein L083_4535 [Actinoplanes sp. N902-109]
MSSLYEFLQVDPRDPGCDEAMAVLHVYAERIIADPAAAGRLFPGVTAHLQSCGPCGVDLAGLMELLRSVDME